MTSTPTREMPCYRCRNGVHALKIASVTGHTIKFSDPGYAPMEIPADMRERFVLPSPGDYYVVYANGDKAFSCGKAFEDHYMLADGGGA